MLFLGLMLSVAVGLAPAAALAFGPRGGGASLTLTAPSHSLVGQSVTATAKLSGGRGQPVGGQPVTLLVDGARSSTGFTNWQGAVSFTIPGSSLKVPRTYLLRAVAGFRTSSGTLSLAVGAVPVAAGGGGGGQIQLGTRLALAIPTGAAIGQDVAVTASLRDAAGRPVAGQRLALMLDGSQLKSDASDATGHVAFSVPGKKLNQARDYAVQATFSGSHGYVASSANATLTVVEAAIRIVTVPPVPSLSFTLGTATAVTGPDGSVALPMPAAGTYRLTPDLNPDPGSGLPAARVSFVRWQDNVVTAGRNIQVDGPATYVMGVRIAYPANVKYVDEDGAVVDPLLVSSAEFAGADGSDVVLNPQTGAGRVWWTASIATAPSDLPTPNTSGFSDLTATPISYSPLSVKVHGVEALAPGQSSWSPNGGGTWTIRLQLYDLSVRAQDVLFGSPAGGKTSLAFPDGTMASGSEGADGTMTFAGLPAGTYVVHHDGSTMKVALSASNSRAVATVRLLTSSDILVLVAAVLALLGLGVLRLVRYRSWRAHRA